MFGIIIKHELYYLPEMNGSLIALERKHWKSERRTAEN